MTYIHVQLTTFIAITYITFTLQGSNMDIHAVNMDCKQPYVLRITSRELTVPNITG